MRNTPKVTLRRSKQGWAEITKTKGAMTTQVQSMRKDINKTRAKHGRFTKEAKRTKSATRGEHLQNKTGNKQHRKLHPGLSITDSQELNAAKMNWYSTQKTLTVNT